MVVVVVVANKRQMFIGSDSVSDCVNRSPFSIRKYHRWCLWLAQLTTDIDTMKEETKKKKQKQKILLKFIKTKEISAFSNKYKIGNNQRLKKKSKETHYKYNFRRGQKICTRFLFSFLFFDQIFIKLCKKKNGRQKIYLSFFCLFVFQQLLCLFFCGPLLFFFGSVLMTKSVVLTIVFSIVCFKAFFFCLLLFFFFPFFCGVNQQKENCLLV